MLKVFTSLTRIFFYDAVENPFRALGLNCYELPLSFRCSTLVLCQSFNRNTIGSNLRSILENMTFGLCVGTSNWYAFCGLSLT